MMIDTKSRTLLIIDMKPFCYVMLEVVRHCFKQIQKCPCFRIFRIKSIGVGSHAMDITTKMISCDMNNNLSLISLLIEHQHAIYQLWEKNYEKINFNGIIVVGDQ